AGEWVGVPTHSIAAASGSPRRDRASSRAAVASGELSRRADAARCRAERRAPPFAWIAPADLSSATLGVRARKENAPMRTRTLALLALTLFGGCDASITATDPPPPPQLPRDFQWEGRW